MTVSRHTAQASQKAALVGRPGCITLLCRDHGPIFSGRHGRQQLALLFVPTTPEIPGIFRQVRISSRFDLHVSSNPDCTDSHDLVEFLSRLGGLRKYGKYIPSGCRPITPDQPFHVFRGMPSAQHAPKLFKDIGVDTAEGFRCHHVAVLVRPTSKRVVELLDQDRHRRADVFTD